jgi:IS30 family transposase
MDKFKHLNENDRYAIMHSLNDKKSFKEIGREIKRNCTTVSKEIRLRRVFKQSGCIGNNFNDCKHRIECSENSLCNGNPCRNKLCKRCTRTRCSVLCEEYEKEICQKRETPPYVCNSCETRNRCTLEKAFYNARGAHMEYKNILSEARSGICADEGEIQRLDNYISPLLKNGQSVHHILSNSSGNIMWSEKTIYKYVDMGLFKARNIDLRRQVRFRPRKSKHESLKVDKACHIGRTYADFQQYSADNPHLHVVEMDTVIGRQGGKCLLTLHFKAAHFMFAFILGACTAAAVNNTFRLLRDILGLSLFSKLFPLLLGDRGSEFSDPKSIEVDESGEIVSRVFYCDPQQSQQKAAIEKNHVMIRFVIPKGTSMDMLVQDDISLMMDHINSYGRAELNDRTPYHMFGFLFGDNALKKMGVNLIPPKNIVLRPLLLKK